MANRDTCRKHNMIANLDKTASNIDFHAVIDFLTGSSLNFAPLVNLDIIGPWIQEFWVLLNLIRKMMNPSLKLKSLEGQFALLRPPSGKIYCLMMKKVLFVLLIKYFGIHLGILGMKVLSLRLLFRNPYLVQTGNISFMFCFIA